MYVLYTGGTLGMIPRDPDNPASPLTPGDKESLEPYLPLGKLSDQGIDLEIEGLYEFDGTTPVRPIDSSDVTSEHWRLMAAQIGRVYDDYDGFVILHGTDTMAYTTSALSFMLTNLAKPVVVTGSQLPLADTRTDAVSNFVNAVHVAGYRVTGQPLVPEVVLSFADCILRGNRVRKMSSVAWQGFDTPNFPHLGSIGEHIRIFADQVRAPADNDKAPFYTRTDLESNIADVSLFPGIHPTQLNAILGSDTLRGVILRTYGAGNAPSNPELLAVIEAAVKAGRVIVNVTQCPQGMVEAGLYEASSGLLEKGVISGVDMTPEAALTKLMTLLANEPASEVASLMQIDQRGEQSESLFDVRFGSSKGASRSDDAVTVAARPAGEFKPADLQRAMLRVRGLRAGGVAQGDTFAIHAFINHPSATKSTGDNDPRHAARFEIAYGDSATTLADVTGVARRVVEGGRAISLTLVPEKGDNLEFDDASLAMFTR